MSDVYLSSRGSDTASGSSSQPVATLARALQIIRGTTAPRRVLVRGGTYRLNTAMEIGKSDQGLTIQAADATPPLFTGARQVSGQWEAQQDGSYRLRHVGGVVGQVWLNGAQLAPSQLPIAGFFRADRTLSQNTITCTDVQATDRSADAVVRPYAWYEEVVPCDVVPGRVTLRAPCRESLARDGEPGVFRLRNVRAGLVPGTWYHDRRSADLYLRLPQGAFPSDLATVEVVNGPVTLLNCEGSDVTLRGLRFRCANLRRQSLAEGGDYTSHAVRVLGGVNVVLDAVDVADVGAGGILAHSTVGVTIVGSRIADVGESAVTIVGDALTFAGQVPASRRAVVDRCTIIRPGRACASYAGIHLASTLDAAVQHSRIEGCPHNGIRVNGVEGFRRNLSATGGVIICANVIVETLLECSDGGGVYFWGAQQRVSTVKGNVIQRVGAPRLYRDDVLANVGVYADDWANDVDILSNAIEGCDWGLNFHRCRRVGAQDNLIVGVRRHWWNQQWETPDSDQSGNIVYRNVFRGQVGCSVKTDWGLQGLQPAPLVAKDNLFVEEFP